jgi:PIN domain nuclease of toxin-antitoxin system
LSQLGYQKKAKSAIEQARVRNEELAISDISLSEIASLSQKARIQLNTGLEAFLSEIESRFVVLPMTWQICAQAVAFGRDFLRDPADRVIAATALVKGAPLISADRALRAAAGLSTIW